MADEVDRGNSSAAGEPPRDPERILAPRGGVAVTDVLSLGPTLAATIVGFLCLLAGPWICLHVLATIWEDAIGEDRVAGLFILATFEETLVIAVVGALLFSVVDVILQAWQHQRLFPSHRPVVLAFPIALGLLVPEALMRGGSLLAGVVVGSTLALSFSAQWATLVCLRESMD